MTNLDRNRVRRALVAHDGNRIQAAEALKIPVGELRAFLDANVGLRESALETIERSLDDAEAELIACLRGSNPRLKLMAAAHILRQAGRF